MLFFEETKALLNNSSFYYIISTDMNGRYTYINNHYRNTFGPIYGPIVGEPYQITMHPDDTNVCVEVAAKCFANPDKIYPATIRKHDGNGGYVITQWEYKAIFDENNEPAGMFCLGHDITQFVQQNEKLTNTQMQLNQKNDILQEIAFSQSHLVRSPLANIMGLVKVLEKMELDQNMKNICRMLIESSKKLDQVVKDISGKTYYN